MPSSVLPGTLMVERSAEFRPSKIVFSFFFRSWRLPDLCTGADSDCWDFEYVCYCKTSAYCTHTYTNVRVNSEEKPLVSCVCVYMANTNCWSTTTTTVKPDDRCSAEFTSPEHHNTAIYRHRSAPAWQFETPASVFHQRAIDHTSRIHSTCTPHCVYTITCTHTYDRTITQDEAPRDDVVWVCAIG